MASICDASWESMLCACGCGEQALYICSGCHSSCFSSEDHHKLNWSGHRCDLQILFHDLPSSTSPPSSSSSSVSQHSSLSDTPSSSFSSFSSSSLSSSFSSLSVARLEVGSRVYAEFEDLLAPAIVLLEEGGRSPAGKPEYWYFVHFEGLSGDLDCWQPAISLVRRCGLAEARMELVRRVQRTRRQAAKDRSRRVGRTLIDKLTAASGDPTAKYLKQDEGEGGAGGSAREEALRIAATEPAERQPLLGEVVFCEHNKELQCATILATDAWADDESPGSRFQKYYYLRYEGCSDRWNEWVCAEAMFLDIPAESMEKVLRSLRETDAPALEQSCRGSLKPGHLCVLLHTDGMRYLAVVLVNDFSLSVDRTATLHYRVHLVGASDDHDCWVSAQQLSEWTPQAYQHALSENARKRTRKAKQQRKKGPSVVPVEPILTAGGWKEGYRPPPIDGRQCPFRPGEKIFAEFHGLPYCARVLCTDAWDTGDDAEGWCFFLYIEYVGWSARWREWIESSLAEPWNPSRYNLQPPPPPLVRIFPPYHPEIFRAPPQRYQFPEQPGLPKLGDPATQLAVLRKLMDDRPPLQPAVFERLQLELPSPLSVVYLSYRLGVAPSFSLVRHWIEFFTKQAIAAHPDNLLSHPRYHLLERSVLLDQLSCLASIYSMLYLGVILESSPPFAWNIDLSRGMSRVPVPAVNLLSKELPHFTYTAARFGDPSIPLHLPNDFLISCNCSEACVWQECPCGYESGHRLVYNDQSLLSQTILSKPVGIFECNAGCSCTDACANRVVQRGSLIPTLIFASASKGWGLMTLVDIPKGAFVMECTGEIITHDEAELRGRTYDLGNLSFLFDLDHEAAHAICRYTIDMASKGNHGRFVNHSCNPNLAPFYVWIETHDKDLPHIALFAIRHIAQGEELTFDYRYPNQQRIECKCESQHCRRYLC